MIKSITPLFIVGHKRSGSTFLGRILNMHPEIYISNETDILWLLFQHYNKLKFEKHPHDGPFGLNKSLEKYAEELESDLSPYEMFCKIQMRAMEDGFMSYEPTRKPELKYLGDQKPFQNADPQLVDFCAENFPPCKYLHLIRHPKDVVRSCKRFGPGKDGGWMWKDKKKQEILSDWVKAENWVDLIKHQNKRSVIDLRYEDLVNEPIASMKNVFDNLNLTYSESLLRRIENTIIKNNRKKKIHLKITREAQEVVERYNYE
ncbi:MAG: sulfotransferase [Saprospiraceae bacterium]|nr:sulfotransferase [Bacteroidia bacterium]NNL92415.1 sulfotransferase [Saprospiraceae bacterium]